MATSAKFPAALLALLDVGGEMAGFPEAVLSGAHNASVTTITLTATVPTAWPTAGWVTIDTEIIQYGAKSGATLTSCTRGSQSTYGGSVAAAHADAAKVGLYLTPQAWNQAIADLIATEKWIGAATPVATIASATTTDLSTLTTMYAQVTGTTTITGFGTVGFTRLVVLEFAGALTLTHNATSLILRDGVNATTAAGDVYIFVSEGSGNWREVSRRTGEKRLISRYVNNAALNVTNSAAGTYVDFGGSFTTSVTTLTGDLVRLVVSTTSQKSTGGAGDIVFDRGGTKVPAAGGSSQGYRTLIASYLPVTLEVWDAPAAGTYTYKPQVWTNDANAMNVGGGNNCQFVVEVWR